MSATAILVGHRSHSSHQSHSSHRSHVSSSYSSHASHYSASLAVPSDSSPEPPPKSKPKRPPSSPKQSQRVLRIERDPPPPIVDLANPSERFEVVSLLRVKGVPQATILDHKTQLKQKVAKGDKLDIYLVAAVDMGKRAVELRGPGGESVVVRLKATSHFKPTGRSDAQ